MFSRQLAQTTGPSVFLGIGLVPLWENPFILKVYGWSTKISRTLSVSGGRNWSPPKNQYVPLSAETQGPKGKDSHVEQRGFWEHL